MNSVKHVPAKIHIKGPEILMGMECWRNLFKNVVVYFTKLLQYCGYKYLLVFVCTFSG